MFTGIVRAVGALKSIRQSGGGCILQVDLGVLDAALIQPGDSMAVNGACLTVTELRGGQARFDVSPETLAKCLIGEWTVGERLNLEPALTLQTPLGGHLASGHIDGTGELSRRQEAEDFTCMTFITAGVIGGLIAVKGSLAINGVSLTVNQVSDSRRQTQFEVMLVPHTLKATTLGALRPGARVHLEVDSVARYAQRLLAFNNSD